VDSWGPRIDVLDVGPDPSVGTDASGGVLGHARTCPAVDILNVTHQVAARDATSRWCVLAECSTGCISCKESAQTTPASIKCDACDIGYNLNSGTLLCEGTYIAYR